MDDNFEKWLAQWDAAQTDIANELKNRPPQEEVPVRTSFFNDAPSDHDLDGMEDGPDQDWFNLYHRAMEIDYKDDLITDSVNVAYMGSEGFGKHIEPGKTATGGKKVYTNNPIHFSSVGNDQEDETGRTRVTKNWNDGDELRELDEIKKSVEQLERKFHEADVLKKTSERSKIQTQLESLRERVKKLSEKLTSDPQQDLA
jgi:Mg2+ and Co2+ transporter CorA